MEWFNYMLFPFMLGGGIDAFQYVTGSVEGVMARLPPPPMDPSVHLKA